MRIKHPKLTHIRKDGPFEHFVAGMYARSACLPAGVNKVIATLFCRRLRVIIAEKVTEEAGELAVKSRKTRAVSCAARFAMGVEKAKAQKSNLFACSKPAACFPGNV